ncbi:primase-helicase family protein [Parabacteroides segnis]|uniref:primase-helicase family protein n=1 Tax=Parabacteroides segnis TaxID=2763058 RepID=UPI00351487ED
MNNIKDKRISINDVVRVADKYYQLVLEPDGNQKWTLRDKIELKQDGCILSNVPKYLGWTVKHNCINYQQEIDGWLNLSAPPKWEPIEGKFPTIEKLFSHIFGEQLELGYDRYSLLIRNPEQLQPILVLTSKEQSTGKTTLLKFDSLLFGTNAVILNISQYCQQFNGLYASKITIGIDETIISESFIKERLKQDSTANTIQLRKMHSEHVSIPFFAKFTLCTNRETDFARLEEEDMRFWVRKVGKIKNFDADFDKKLEKEIPAFLYFVMNRKMSVPKPLSRQWFSKEQLYTEALGNVLKESRSKLAKDIEVIVKEKISELNKDLYITAGELSNLLGNKYSISDISKCLKREMRIAPPKQMRYKNIYGIDKNGRPYYFPKNFVTEE